MTLEWVENNFSKVAYRCFVVRGTVVNDGSTCGPGLVIMDV